MEGIGQGELRISGISCIGPPFYLWINQGFNRHGQMKVGVWVSDEEEKSIYVRESAAVALGMIGDMRAVDPFLSILEAKKNFLDKFTFLKERVIEALGKIDFSSNHRVISVFKNALLDESPQVRLNAVESLMNSNCDEAYDLIKDMLYDSDEEVARSSVIALYNLRGEEALNEILELENIPYYCKEEARSIQEEEEEE